MEPANWAMQAGGKLGAVVVFMCDNERRASRETRRHVDTTRREILRRRHGPCKAGPGSERGVSHRERGRRREMRRESGRGCEHRDRCNITETQKAEIHRISAESQISDAEFRLLKATQTVNLTVICR